MLNMNFNFNLCRRATGSQFKNSTSKYEPDNLAEPMSSFATEGTGIDGAAAFLTTVRFIGSTNAEREKERKRESFCQMQMVKCLGCQRGNAGSSPEGSPFLQNDTEGYNQIPKNKKIK
jgi:hypothetical protein